MHVAKLPQQESPLLDVRLRREEPLKHLMNVKPQKQKGQKP
jgi:hypothetical protein